MPSRQGRATGVTPVKQLADPPPLLLSTSPNVIMRKEPEEENQRKKTTSQSKGVNSTSRFLLTPDLVISILRRIIVTTLYIIKAEGMS